MLFGGFRNRYCVCGGLPGVAAAQGATATISGTIVDETTAVVRDVTINLVDLATGMKRTQRPVPRQHSPSRFYLPVRIA